MQPAPAMAASAAVYRRWRNYRLPHAAAMEQARAFGRWFPDQDNKSEAEFEQEIAELAAAIG